MKIAVQNISKAFSGRDLISDFSLDIEEGVRLCVAGANGTGKSTFIRMLAGLESLDSGRVIMPRGCRIGYVEQDLAEDVLEVPLLTWVLDVLPDWRDFWVSWEEAIAKNDMAAIQRLGERQADIEAIYGYNPEHKAQAVLSGLGFTDQTWDRPLRTLSGGWRERAKLARVLVAGADVLFLDEPTNHLDIEAVEWLEDYLLHYSGVLVFVAHDRIFMDKVATHVLYFSGPKPIFRKATFSQFMILQAELEEQRQREHQKLSKDIDHKMDFVRRFGAKASKAKQAGSRQKSIDKLSKQLDGLRPEQRRKTLNFAWPKPPPADKTVMSVADVAFSFADGGTLWPPVTFSVFSGQRIAIVGPNGSGKSTLLKILAGALERTGGSIATGSLVRMGYYSQHQTEVLRAQATVISEIRRVADPRTTEEELMSVLGLFMLNQKMFERIVGSLSGGERARLMLATLFIRRCNVLLLDEPTNHLDLESREALVDALSAFQGTIIMIAHDRHLLREVADEAWLVTPEGLIMYPEGFEEYDSARRSALAGTSSRAKRSKGQRAVAPETAVSANANANVKANANANTNTSPKKNISENVSKEDLKRIKREQAEQRNTLHKLIKPKQTAYAKLEESLINLLDEQSVVEKSLADPDVYADTAQTSALLGRFSKLKENVEKIMEDMAGLEESLAELEVQQSKLAD